ncbi:putative DNA primase/helicase [Pseudanabaena phage Pan4]|nr:putative DNA primase/helicase [Pseudanabaena phage Pan4]
MSDGIDDVRKVLSEPEDVDLPEDLRPSDDDAVGIDDSDAPPAPPPEGMDPELLRRAAGLPLNDFGNGQRLQLYFGENLMFVPRVGWFRWNGTVWRKDDDEIDVRRAAQQIGGLILSEVEHVLLSASEMERMKSEAQLRKDRKAAEEAGDEDGQLKVEEIDRKLGEIALLRRRIGTLKKEHRNFARSSGNSGKIEGMMREAGVGLAFTLDQLDSDPLVVNLANGVLVFRVDRIGPERVRSAVKTFYPHDEFEAQNKGLRLTKQMPVEYNPMASCTKFQAFLDRIQPEADMQGFLQRFFGLSMSGIVEQMLCFFYGDGANGKSVLVDLIARILGDYAATAKIESLTGQNRRGGGDATPDLVPLMGARFVRSSEPDQKTEWQEGLIKELTGGEPILVRALQKDFVEVRPKFKLGISGNHKPNFRGTDDGIWRRLKLVPFDVQIPAEERVPKAEMDEALFAEASGILNWMIEGLLDYLERGLQEPARVTEATQELREESDPFGMFLDEVCLVSGDPDDMVWSADLKNAFHFWLGRRGEGQFKDRTVALALKERSRRWRSKATGQKFTAMKSGGNIRYIGIKLQDLFRREFDAAPKDNNGRPLMARVASGEEE